MNRKSKIILLSTALLACVSTNIAAQEVAGDSVMQHVTGKRLSIGGYGEVAMSRMFYSDHVNRYGTNPESYKNDPSHGRFDIPHAVIYIGYDFGRGWTMGTEVEFEHTGTGSTIENEADEAAEWEFEQEKGGEVELEQFWIQKSFARWANVRAGHIVVPVGLNNAYHEPLNYFTVYRPEGENTILPSTWHDTGISFWGNAGKFRYEVQAVAGLNAMLFNRDRWIHSGAGSPFEFKVRTCHVRFAVFSTGHSNPVNRQQSLITLPMSVPAPSRSDRLTSRSTDGTGSCVDRPTTEISPMSTRLTPLRMPRPTQVTRR